MEELRQDLRVVTRKCRPDWDITTAELKAAWQQGRKELFYPCGKTYAQTIGGRGLGSSPEEACRAASQTESGAGARNRCLTCEVAAAMALAPPDLRGHS
jgi:hypothetical protein